MEHKQIKLSIVDEYQIKKGGPFAIFNKIYGFEKNKAVAFYHGYKSDETYVIILEDGKISTIIHPYSLFYGGRIKKLTRYNWKQNNADLVNFFHDNHLLIIENSRNLFWSKYPFQNFDSIKIKGSLPSNKNGFYPHIGKEVGFSDCNEIPFPLHYQLIDENRHFSRLHFNSQKKIAKWIKLDNSFFNKNYLAHLNKNEYPEGKYPASYNGSYSIPLISHICMKENKLHVFTPGANNSIGYGFEYSVYSINNLNGSLIETMFSEGSYQKMNDSKRRGKNGRFSTSLKYLIITPQYKASDSWKGKQRLMEVGQKGLIEPIMPRGYSNFKIVEHGHDTFWAIFWNREHICIISCKGKVV